MVNFQCEYFFLKTELIHDQIAAHTLVTIQRNCPDHNRRDCAAKCRSREMLLWIFVNSYFGCWHHTKCECDISGDNVNGKLSTGSNTATNSRAKCVTKNPFLGAYTRQRKTSSKSLLLTQKWDNFHNRKLSIFSLLEIY